MSADIEGTLIGTGVPRAEAERLASGRGQYTDDIPMANVAHVAFLRSPHAHALIKGIDVAEAKGVKGVISAFTGEDLKKICRPYVTRLAAFPDHISAPQYALAIEETCWQGEAVAAIVAETREAAEDGLELISVDYEILPHVASIQDAMSDGAPLVHSQLTTNLALERQMTRGDVEQAFSSAAKIVECELDFGRQTGVSLEPRTILASFNHALGELSVYQSHQTPFQMREIFAAQLGLSTDAVRVIAPDVGGAFGLKLHAYADELAVVAIACLSDRPVKFVADRLESFVSDAHAREAKVSGRMAFSADGMVLGIDVDVSSGFGAYSCYPRGSVGEALQAVQLAGAPYQIGAFRGRVRGYYQNKVPTGALRGVGQPIACAVTERLMDLGARALSMDPVELRRLNFIKSPENGSEPKGALIVETSTLHECMAAVTQAMDYEALRREQANLREKNIWRGIGFSAFLEITGVGPGLYGPQKIKVSAQEACRVSLTEAGTIRCETSVTDQGQGTLSTLGQVIAEEMGVGLASVRIVAGDTSRTPYGGGAWASRGIALGGEAALRATRKLRENILRVAGSLLQCDSSKLNIADGLIVSEESLPHMTLADLVTAVRFQSDTIPLERLPPFEVLEHVVPENLPYLVSNGVQAALTEVDLGTGLIRVLKFWVADDCGRVINPLLVDEQLRGGVIQGIGAALYEQCEYSEDGQLVTGSLVDYPLPLSTEMPQVSVLHIPSRTKATTLGARGVGEAGVIGSIAAVWSSVNDALAPLGCTLSEQPFTPDRVVESLLAAADRSASE